MSLLWFLHLLKKGIVKIQMHSFAFVNSQLGSCCQLVFLSNIRHLAKNKKRTPCTQPLDTVFSFTTICTQILIAVSFQILFIPELFYRSIQCFLYFICTGMSVFRLKMHSLSKGPHTDS